MRAKSEMAGGHGPMQSAHPIHDRSGTTTEAVVATRIERDEQHRIRMEG